jgi:hypothetical protein
MSKLTAQSVVTHLGKISRAKRQLDRMTSCWIADERAGLKFTDQEHEVLTRAAEKKREAEQLVLGIYKKRIGELIVDEIHSGEFKGLKP